MTRPADTRERILDAARAMANTQGVDAVSIRTIARVLDLSPGNVSYHFARKADLVVALGDELSARNAPLGELAPRTFDELLARYRPALRHQYEHRGIVLALPHLIETYPEMRRRYRQVERSRSHQQREQLAGLRDAGRLLVTEEDLDRLVAHIALVARFWLAEYRTTFYRRAVDDVIDHYLALIAGLLLPYASPEGRAELEPHLASMLHLSDA